MQPFYYVAVNGSPSLTLQQLQTVLDAKLAEKAKTHQICLLLTDEKGVPYLAANYARKNGLYIKYFPTFWTEHKTRANEIRDKEILALANVNITFKDGTNANATRTARMAQQLGIECCVFAIKDVAMES
ncbi:MAG: hypothetical protein LLF76_02635 [Planctomycetaceae bacterium]|nr:hypothetical protein [Planctomycetaceae bacterium]